MSQETPYRYDAAMAERIELAWQDRWEEQGTFHAPNPSGPWADPRAVGQRPKLFVMDMFPYPSGAGLHVGHPLGYIATDVYSRYFRMRGRNVLHCLGYDAFGLPAEQYAVQTGQHPRKTTQENIVTMAAQMRRLGLGHDDRRSVATMDPEFYRWTQWIFRRIFQSWYEPHADGGRGKARPIGELVAALESGRRATPDGRPWQELSAAEQRQVVDGERLAYVANAPVNWCPGLGTVLSNEEVTNEGRSERGNYPVFKRDLSQWMMRITKYADRLADDLDRLDWPEPVKLMQRNWIGRSYGARIRFDVVGAGRTGAAGTRDVEQIEVFTTRPDTLFGATFMVLAPEHPLLDRIVPQGKWAAGTPSTWTAQASGPAASVEAYRCAASRKSDLERQVEGRAKTGVFTGAWARNPANGKPVPVFVADYVLMGYGTGAVMGVPAQDARDWEFAVQYDLPIVRTVRPPASHPQDQAYVGEGPAVNSANDQITLNGLSVSDAKAATIAWLEGVGAGQGTVTYKLRDWLFSRQRYWGEPFPIVYDQDGAAIALPDSMLPVELPDVPDYSPKTFEADDADSEPEPPLSRVPDWVNVELDLGGGPKMYRRETNTMPNWAGSCWYELRYLDPTNRERFVDPGCEHYWMGPQARPVADTRDGAVDPGGVDLYVGGVEHAVLHLLYSRFWHKVLHDLGEVESEEPFRRLVNQGYIQAYAYTDARGQYVPAAEVVEHVEGSRTTYTWNGEVVNREYGKIGKSRKNVVTPDEIFAEYGADTFRVYEMSMGPLDVSRPWETRAVVGAQRFLQRLWRNVIDEESGQVRVVDQSVDQATARLVARTVAGVRADYEGLRFNTAIAKLIELNNALTPMLHVPRDAAQALVLMTAPLAPHVCEELWSRLGHSQTLTFEAFPEADPQLLVERRVTCVLQVRGRLRDRIEVAADISEDDLRRVALANEKVRISLAGAPVRTVVVRAPRLVNVVPG